MTFPVVPLLYTYCEQCKEVTTTLHARQHMERDTTPPPIHMVLVPLLAMAFVTFTMLALVIFG